jgi:Ca2+-dependent lipid-binding protein
MELRVRVRDGVGLPQTLVNNYLAPISPYFTLALCDRGQEKRTTAKHGVQDPNWEEDFVFDIVSYNSDILKLVLYSDDPGIDGRFSKLHIQVCALPPGQIVDQVYQLERLAITVTTTVNSGPRYGHHRHGGHHGHHQYYHYEQPPGKVHLGLQVALKGTISWQVSPFPLFQVIVTVIEAKDVPKMDTVGKCDPFCFVALVGSRLVYRTRIMKKTYTPVWNETVSFLLTNPNTDVLTILLKDEDMIVDDAIGNVDIPLAPYLNGPELERWSPLTPAKGVKDPGQVHYKLRVCQAPPMPYVDHETGRTNATKPAMLKAP